MNLFPETNSFVGLVYGRTKKNEISAMQAN